jgi:hypothetical protein
MFILTHKVESTFVRFSKLGKEHFYTRDKTIALFRCDSCQEIFSREIGKVDPKRLNNNYYHVCATCNPKQFAQKKGVENRKFWSTSVDSDLDISKI